MFCMCLTVSVSHVSVLVKIADKLLVAHLFAVPTSSPHWVTDITTNGQKMDIRVSKVDI